MSLIHPKANGISLVGMGATNPGLWVELPLSSNSEYS
jgi:hypothetical protein